MMCYVTHGDITDLLIGDARKTSQIQEIQFSFYYANKKCFDSQSAPEGSLPNENNENYEISLLLIFEGQ